MLDLSSLDQFKEKKFEPSNLDFIYYIFWEKGISLKEFNELPMPYIFSIVNTDIYMKEQEAKQHEKSNKKNKGCM